MFCLFCVLSEVEFLVFLKKPRMYHMTTWFLVLPVLVFMYAVTNQLFNKILNLPPSPYPCLPILGHLYLLKPPLHRVLANISALHGPILLFRFGFRRVLVVSSPSAAEECLTKNDVAFANRPRLIVGEQLGYNHTSLVWAPYGDHWRNLRRISSLEILSPHRLQALSGVRVDEIKSMIRRLSDVGRGRRAVDVKALFFDLTLNVMMRTIAGKRYYGEEARGVEEARRFRNVLAEATELSTRSHLGDFLPLVRRVAMRGMERRLVESRASIDGLMQGLIDEHREKMTIFRDRSKNKNMIEVMLSLQQTEPEYYTDEIIKGLIIVMLMAGTDTTITTMEWGLALLLNHPHLLKKAQLEIDGVVGHGRLIQESDIPQLPYLRSVVNETLRLYPPAPLLVAHESSQDCTVGGYKVPSGTVLLVNAWAIQNDGKSWAEPKEFKPERFEEKKDGSLRMIPFGSGRRGCPGEGLASRMVWLSLGSVLQCFEWERVGEEPVDMKEQDGFALSKAVPLEAVCRPRQAMLNVLSQI